MRSILIIFLLLQAFAASAALADEGAPAIAAADAALEQRVQALSGELRCLVCQNQSLADSHAPLALDLKRQVREQLAAGQSDQQVIDFMVARYGDFVLYRPPVKATTWLLWFGPFLLLAVALAALLRRLARRRQPDHEITEVERRRAAELLSPDAGERKHP